MTAYADAAVQGGTLPRATVRSQVVVPLRFPDGFTATAEVVTFHGLVDGKEHLLLALGKWEQALLDRLLGEGLPATAVEDIVTAMSGAASSHDEMLYRVDEPVPRLRERAEETEQLRRLPDPHHAGTH